MVKFLVQISFIVNLCLIFVYNKDVDGSDSRRNRLYFLWEESQSEIGLEGHGCREGKNLSDMKDAIYQGGGGGRGPLQNRMLFTSLSDLQ